MDFKEEIVQFMTDKVGGITIVAEGSAEIVYADSYFRKKYGDAVVGMDAEEIFVWNDDCPALEIDGDAVEWEYIDTNTKKYFKFNSGLFQKEGKNYKIHQITDITEYMGLNRDITKYMGFFRKLSKFQTTVLEKLSETYYELLPMLADYFNTSKAYFMIQRDEVMDVITYNKMGNVYSNDRIGYDAGVAELFESGCEDDVLFGSFDEKVQEILRLNGAKDDSTYRMLVSGEVSGQKYALYLGVWPNMDWESMNESTLKSVISLYIENGVMREKLVYASEHDGLTGLYNKAKYLEMAEKEFQSLDSIAIFNFDVNNLKKMNDQFGHEAGDKLIIKAANSFRKVTSNRVHAFRMGGDEFLLVAENISKTETDKIRQRWEEELARLNMADDGIDCVVAVGVAYSEKEYDYAALLKLADERMYEDKKAKKKPGEENR